MGILFAQEERDDAQHDIAQTVGKREQRHQYAKRRAGGGDDDCEEHHEHQRRDARTESGELRAGGEHVRQHQLTGVHIRQPHAHIHGDGDHQHADHDAVERGEDIGIPFLQWQQQAAEGNSL